MSTWKTILIIGFASILNACGGGGGDSSTPTPPTTQPPPPPPPPDQKIGGAWVGSDGSGSEILALSTEDGRVHWVIPETGEQGFGTGTVSGSSVTIDYTYVAPLGFTLSDGSTSASCTATGTIQERQSLSLNTSCTTSLGATFTNTASLAYDDLYDRDSSLAVIAGNWDDFGIVLTVSANGQIFEQDPFTGCVVNGQAGIIDSQYNAYDISITYSSCQGDFAFLNGSTFTGLAILDNTVVPEQATFGLVGNVLGTTVSYVSTISRL